MRKPILSLALVALVVAACGSSSSLSGGYVRPPDPQDHGSPPEPRPAATPYDGVKYRRLMQRTTISMGDGPE